MVFNRQHIIVNDQITCYLSIYIEIDLYEIILNTIEINQSNAERKRLKYNQNSKT